MIFDCDWGPGVVGSLTVSQIIDYFDEASQRANRRAKAAEEAAKRARRGR